MAVLTPLIRTVNQILRRRWIELLEYATGRRYMSWLRLSTGKRRTSYGAAQNWVSRSLRPGAVIRAAESTAVDAAPAWTEKRLSQKAPCRIRQSMRRGNKAGPTFVVHRGAPGTIQPLNSVLR